MKRPWILVGLFLITLGTIAAIAFWAPDREWDRDGRGVDVVQVVDAEGNAIDGGATVIVERDHRGFPFGLLFIPLILLIVFGLWRSGFRGPRWGGPWGPGGDRGERWLDEWHARQHQELEQRAPSTSTDPT